VDHKNKVGYILDPTIRLEYAHNQDMEVDKEKKNIYNPCIKDLKSRYKFDHPIEVIGLFFGARGTITKYCTDILTKTLKLRSEICYQIALASLKGSVSILKHHLYNPSLK